MNRRHCVCLVVQNYDYAEAAAKLRCKQRWLEDHVSELPHQEFGRSVAFCDCDLRVIQRIRAVVPEAVEALIQPATDEPTQAVPVTPALANIRPSQGRRRTTAGV